MKNPRIFLYHFTFATKYRKKLLVDDHRRATVEYCIQHICKIKEMECVAVAAQSDHVHVFVQTRKQTLSVPEIAHLIKWFSSVHTRRLIPELKAQPALWQQQYFCRTVGGDAATVKRYIERHTKK